MSRIDLLAQDAAGNLVVIELKAGEAGREVLGQILPRREAALKVIVFNLRLLLRFRIRNEAV